MFDRSAGQRRVASTKDMVFPSPTKGWVQSGNITTASPDQAEVLDNFIPTSQGARLRGGLQSYADIGAAITRLFSYSGGNAVDFFAATATSIFDAERINAGGFNTFAEMEGLTSGDWSTTQISTSGGEFLAGVNGSDYAFYWDGIDFNPVAGETIYNLEFDALTAEFAVGETVSGATASAVIYGITKTSATAGTLKVGAITSSFVDNETITSASGSATANIPSGTSTASTVSISGIATTELSQMWIFKERAFFVEKNSQSVWYLSVQSIGGAATELPLGAVFKRGGKVLFGANWSLDSGAGLDDVCIFVTDNGEVAVYQGTDPSSASTWALVGVYDISVPFDKHSFFKAGGDLAIVTKDGIIPISEATKKDRAALRSAAITYPVEDFWKTATSSATSSYPVSATLWQSGGLLLVGTPYRENAINVSLIANAATGAWCRITGWDVRCSAVHADDLYIANEAGLILKADAGGTDNGTQYTGIYVPKFSDNGSPTVKVANHGGITYRAASAVTFKMVANADYQVNTTSAPTPTNTASAVAWGTGVWGTFVWGDAGLGTAFTKWKTVSARGYSLAPSVLISSNQNSLVDFEILATRLRYETAYVL